MKNLFTISLFLFSAFTNAQTACDSLNFVSIQYSPFTDTLIYVHVKNEQAEIFGYPGFVILDSNDDTVAVETVNYFGIGAESVHALDVRPGMHDPTTNFEGTLELHTNFYESLACSWEMDQSLCANVPCDSMIIGFQNWGGALVIGDFAWSVLDSLGTVVESGVLEMTVEEQYWYRGLCLTPGMYSYNLYALDPPTGGGPTMTVSNSRSFAAATISMPMNWTTGNTLEVPFFMHCIAEPPTGIREDFSESVSVHRIGEQTQLRSADAMKTVNVISSDGRLVGTYSPNSDAFHFPAALPNGVYFVQVGTDKGLMSLKVLL